MEKTLYEIVWGGHETIIDWQCDEEQIVWSLCMGFGGFGFVKGYFLWSSCWTGGLCIPSFNRIWGATEILYTMSHLSVGFIRGELRIISIRLTKGKKRLTHIGQPGGYWLLQGIRNSGTNSITRRTCINTTSGYISVGEYGGYSHSGYAYNSSRTCCSD